MTKLVTVSAKVSEELKRRADELRINTSALVRRALEDEVERMELQHVLQTLEDEVKTAPELPDGTVVEIIRSMTEGPHLPSEFSKAVLDASILVQTLLGENHTDVALKLVGMLKTIYLPSLAFYVIGNALAILARENFITKKDAVRKFKSISSVPTLNIREVALDKAIDIAIELETTLYEAAYLALALEEDAPLVTADRELYEKGKKVAKAIHTSEVTS